MATVKVKFRASSVKTREGTFDPQQGATAGNYRP